VSGVSGHEGRRHFGVVKTALKTTHVQQKNEATHPPDGRQRARPPKAPGDTIRDGVGKSFRGAERANVRKRLSRQSPHDEAGAWQHQVKRWPHRTLRWRRQRVEKVERIHGLAWGSGVLYAVDDGEGAQRQIDGRVDPCVKKEDG
jgi:hypothetical protein